MGRPTDSRTEPAHGGEPAASSSAELASLSRSLFTVAALRLAAVSVVLASLVLHVMLRNGSEARVETWHFRLIVITYGLSILYLLLLRTGSLTRPLAYSQIGLDALLVTALVLMTQGVESPFSFAYVFVVLAASMTLYRRGALLAAVTSVVLFGLLTAGQLLGLFGTPLPWSRALMAFAGNGAGMVLVAFLASTLAEKLRATGQKLAEKESDLAELYELHAAILRSLPAGVLTVDNQGVIRFANESARAILRAEPRALVGQPLEQVVPSMASVWERFQATADHGGRHEADHVLSDRESMRLGFSVAPLNGPGELSAILVFQDVTDIVRLKDAVARSERLASVGQFAAGLAHEVRNPLASMCASIDVLRASLTPPEPMQRLMMNVTREAERLNRLITDFLVLARPRQLEYRDCNLSQLVSSVLEMLESEDLMSMELERVIEPDIWIRADPDLIRQVIWNLVKNGTEALRPRGGTLRVEVWKAEGEPAVRVVDDGPGVPAERITQIFSPFFTTKEGGSGLGLAITNSIVEAHGAHMEFDSVVGEGTVVTIRFDPVATRDLQLPDSAVA
jgi:two-component system sensor histidine kinase PilS (NtrC family)